MTRCQSIELRITTEGECECGTPHQLGYEPGCRHDIECDWGTFGDPPLLVADHSTETTTVENIAALILVSRRFVDSGGTLPPDCCPEMDITTIFTRDGRRFMRWDAHNGSWTWEIFDAHWSDGYPPNVYVGRWPD